MLLKQTILERDKKEEKQQQLNSAKIPIQSRSIIVRSIIVRFLAFLKKNFKNADILDNYGTNFILVFKEE
jgi:hypothetical protein